jgi:hypothetical protein
LHVERWKDGIAIWGTAYRMTLIEQAAANHFLGNSLNPGGDADHRIIEFLQNRGPIAIYARNMNLAIYARKSTEQNGVADDEKSVARQIEHAKQYAERRATGR